ncbi:hypothetical protein DFH09DRAFT_1144387 [Mycena vulgaris]|nr:hypothetical protein DFH09DRAFT_1144387 [Mycena vulgaris]
MIRQRSGRHVFICAIVALSLFATAQMIHQVVITVLMLRSVDFAAVVGEKISAKPSGPILHLVQVKGFSDNILSLTNKCIFTYSLSLCRVDIPQVLLQTVYLKSRNSE